MKKSIDRDNGPVVADHKEKAVYEAPVLTTWGNVADLTRVGTTNSGDDVLPGGAQGNSFGSVNPGGLE